MQWSGARPGALHRSAEPPDGRVVQGVMRIVISLGLVVLAVVVWLILREPRASAPALAPAVASTATVPEAATNSAPGPAAGPARPAPSRLPPPSPSLPPPKGMKAQLKERVASLDPVIAGCLALANERLTGVAVLDFVAGVEPATGLAVVETTGIVDDGTTIESEPVLACLHEAARGLAPFQVPGGIETAYAAWRVELVDGEVKDRRVTEYALRKPTDGPFD